MLLPIENVLSKEEVQQFRSLLELTPWLDGKLTAGGQAMHVKANLQVDDSAESAVRLRNTILQQLSNHPLFISAALPGRIYPPKFNRYQNGGHYGLHVDNAIMPLADGRMLRTDVSCTLFLSEPEEYDGGELTIETCYGAQAVKLPAGDMILYPSTRLHEVKPVTRGSRICAFFWIESMVRDSQQRELLFELDQSIQALTVERGADDNEVRRLSGVYHNLIRTWGDS